MKAKQRKEVFDKYGGKCAYCGCDLKKGWHVDHIEPIIRNWWNGTCENPENENVENYNPSCQSCNINKHQMSLEGFRESIEKYIDSLNKYSAQYRMAKKYNLIYETKRKVQFYFENFNNVI